MPNPLTSLANFKRALTVGSRWEARYADLHRDPTGTLTPRVTGWTPRHVVHVQGNAVCFTLPTPEAIAAGTANPRGAGSWLWFPKAKLCTFPDGAIRISHDANHWREYRPLPATDERAPQ